METHAKILGILNIVCGVIGLLGAVVLGLVFTAGAVGASGDDDAAVALPIIGLTGMALVLVTVAMSMPAVIIGWGLYTLRPWARIAGIVLAILSLMVFPLGTVLGVYGLWVLFSGEGARLFTGMRTTRA
jgi:hypothetical protein